jgi:hypothetical protein
MLTERRLPSRARETGCWALARVGRRHRTAQVIRTLRASQRRNHRVRTSAPAVDCYGQCCADVTQAVVGESPDPVNQHGDRDALDSIEVDG